MIKDDDFDSINIEVTTERLVVWIAARTREATLPHYEVAEMLGSLVDAQTPLCTAQCRVHRFVYGQAGSARYSG